MMLTDETEPEIVYGTAFQRHLEVIWNSRISHPHSEILLFDDDVKGAFRHCKYHPDIATAFSFIIENFSLFLWDEHLDPSQVHQILNQLQELEHT